MAQETVGYNIFVRFQFFGKAGTAQMKQTSMAFASLRRNATLARAGVAQAATGVRSLSMVGMGAAYAIGKVVTTAASFNQQMSVVRSVTNLTGAQFKKLNDRALQLGATTTFTAKEVGQGMENFGRAGFNAIEITKAIRPALKMAEADSMKLNDSTRILADGMRTFGLDASRTAYAADVLAFTSKNTNTNIMALGEGLTYAGPAAKRAGMNFHETVGTLGLLANIGIKASRSGTVLKNAWIKLTQMSRPAIKLFGSKAGLTKVLTDNNGKMRKFHHVMAQVILRLKGVKNEALRNNLAFKIFGIRGVDSMAALEAAAKSGMVKRMMVDIKEASKGTAEEMARIQQANLAGDWKRFTSAVSGAAIAMGNVLIPTIRSVFEGAGGLTDVIGRFARAIKMVNEGAKESAVVKKYGKTIAGIVFGIKEGFAAAKAALKTLGKAFMEVFGQFVGNGKNTVKTIARIVTKFVVLAAALAPVAVAIGGIAFVAKGMFNVLAGGFKLVTALASPWGIAFMLIIRLFAGSKRKGESFFATMARGLKNVTAFAYKLTAPFRWLIKKLGVIPGLITAIVAMKGFKLLLGGLGRGLIRGVAGGAAGGLGGGLIRGVAGGAAGAAGAGATGVGAGAAGAGATGVKAAIGAVVKSVGVKAAATGMAGLSASIGVWFLGLKKLADAHSTKAQKELRTRLGKQYKDMVDKHMGFGDSLVRMASKALDEAAGYETKVVGGIAFRVKKKGPVPAKPEGGRMGRTMESMLAGRAGAGALPYFAKTIAPFLEDVSATARTGFKGEARAKLQKAGITGETLRRFMGDLSKQGKEYYKFTPQMVKALTELSASMKKPKAPTIVNLNVDGKKLATVTATHRQESRERSGRVPPPGARRRALRTGTE